MSAMFQSIISTVKKVDEKGIKNKRKWEKHKGRGGARGLDDEVAARADAFAENVRLGRTWRFHHRWRTRNSTCDVNLSDHDAYDDGSDRDYNL